MNAHIATFVLAFVAVTSTPALAGTVVADSSFDADAEGWDVRFANEVFELPVAYDGYEQCISIADLSDGDTWYFSAPEEYLGAQASVYGGTLRFSLRDVGAGSLSDSAYGIQLVGGKATSPTVLYLPVDAPRDGWEDYEAVLKPAAGWWHSSGRAATAKEMQLVLANLMQLNIQAEYVSGNDVGEIDDVSLSTP
jgi:hypothetical protein